MKNSGIKLSLPKIQWQVTPGWPVAECAFQLRTQDDDFAKWIYSVAFKHILSKIYEIFSINAVLLL